MNQKRLFFLRKLIGVVFVLAAVSIFVYLGWFYFIMPKLIVNQRDVLADAFDERNFFESYTRYQNKTIARYSQEGTIVGGVWYPPESYTVEPIIESSPTGFGKPSGQVHVSIAELGIHDALVQLDVDGTDESMYHSVLTWAVAHFAHTAYPGQKGNMFLFGHSKLPILAGSDYESIFTNLPRIKNGALIEISANDLVYRYRVNYTAVLSPKDVFILNQPKEDRLLTVMTCIPPGFGSERYVAVSNLIGVEQEK